MRELITMIIGLTWQSRGRLNMKEKLKTELIQIENQLAELSPISEKTFHKLLESIEPLSIPGLKIRIKSRKALLEQFLSHTR